MKKMTSREREFATHVWRIYPDNERALARILELLSEKGLALPAPTLTLYGMESIPMYEVPGFVVEALDLDKTCLFRAVHRGPKSTYPFLRFTRTGAKKESPWQGHINVRVAISKDRQHRAKERRSNGGKPRMKL